MYITKYGCVFLKLGESIYIRGNGSHSHTLGFAHNAQHSLVYYIAALLYRYFCLINRTNGTLEPARYHGMYQSYRLFIS